MRLLLDSQAFVHIASQPELLPVAARSAIEDSNNAVFLSIASPLELQIKINIGLDTFVMLSSQTAPTGTPAPARLLFRDLDRLGVRDRLTVHGLLD